MYVVVSLFHIQNVGIIYSTLWQTTSVVLVSIFQLLVLVTRKNSFDRRYRYLHYHYVLLIDRSLRSPSNYGSYLHSRLRRDCSLPLCKILHGRLVRPRTLVACRRSVLLLSARLALSPGVFGRARTCLGTTEQGTLPQEDTHGNEIAR